jgi:LmbE family N-acetylglucosaminyl deacetylase
VKLFLSPHNDDAALFGTFTILRERPLVVTVFDSYIQEARGTGVTARQRREEDQAAMEILGAPVQFLGISDRVHYPHELFCRFAEFGQPEMVWAPQPEPNGHAHHNLVGEVAGRLFENVTYYMTYTTAGKSVGRRVAHEPKWAILKLCALACYGSQIGQANQVEHFLREQHEYCA